MDPAAPSPRPWFGALETHVSVVLFVGDRVYKLKKPIKTAFLDHSTSSAREMACRKEVALNSRLSPDVYLGVSDIRGPDGAIVDHLVTMRRLPEDRRLSALIQRGGDIENEIASIARSISSFHASATTGPDISAAGHPSAIARRWEANFEEIAPFVGTIFDPVEIEELRRLSSAYIAGRSTLFLERVASELVRDVHGDLLADDIFCLPDGPRILDCIEFDDSLRHIDVLEDIAFLAMDLERLGAPEAARRLSHHYQRFSGELHPTSLFHHYVAYRALVRAKVACLRTMPFSEHMTAFAPPGPDTRWADEATRLLALALRHARSAQVTLVLVGGPPGTGKSTLSDRLARAGDWVVVRSDEVRKQIARSTGPDGFESGLYDPDVTDATYEEMLRRAASLLDRGRPVILDASWRSSRHRDLAALTAERSSSHLIELQCVAPADVAASRIVARGRRGIDPSDATVDVAGIMRARSDAWPTAAPIDTTSSEGRALGEALAAITHELERTRSASHAG